MMTKEYWPRGEIQKLEQEIWILWMIGSDLATYTTRFSDLALLCPGMVTPEDKKVERYIWGQSSQVQGNIVSARPSIFDSSKELAQSLIDHRAIQSVVTASFEQVRGGGGGKQQTKILEQQ